MSREEPRIFGLKPDKVIACSFPNSRNHAGPARPQSALELILETREATTGLNNPHASQRVSP